MHNEIGQCLDCHCSGFHASGCRAGDPDFLLTYAAGLAERANAAYRDLDESNSGLVAELAQVVLALAEKVSGNAGADTRSLLAQLGLRQEWCIPADRGPGVQYLRRKPACPSRTRFVSEWVDDN